LYLGSSWGMSRRGRRDVEEGIVREGFRGPDLEILGTGSWTLGGRRGAVEQWVRTCASGTGVRAGHRRSGDPGLWVRNKEQWADRRVMTANTRVRGPRRVSRSSSSRRPLSRNSFAWTMCSGPSPSVLQSRRPGWPLRSGAAGMGVGT